MSGPTGEQIEQTVVELLEARDPGKTICPSDAARALAGQADFRPLMEPVRARARQMVGRGDLEITQGGKVVDPDTARGAIRLRLPQG
ncbi:MAG TPA: DUF3253 domain-containing protein [Thermoleophilaceae bacterium]|nr:DUF3253 domain-containing protein [Thermoleophilaceae bacterium]